MLSKRTEEKISYFEYQVSKNCLNSQKIWNKQGDLIGLLIVTQMWYKPLLYFPLKNLWDIDKVNLWKLQVLHNPLRPEFKTYLANHFPKKLTKYVLRDESTNSGLNHYIINKGY